MASSVAAEIGGMVLKLIDKIFIMANGLVYDFIGFLYEIYIAISSAKIFTSATMQEIANRVYIVIGIAALFLIAYALLRAIIDPDSGGKDYSVNKVVPNIIKVVILIAIVPWIFSFAYNMQEVILGSNIMNRIVFGENYENYDDEDHAFTFKEAGREMAVTTFTAFLHPAINPTTGKAYPESSIEIVDCSIGGCEKDASESKPYTFADAKAEVADGKKNFNVFANFAELIHSDSKAKEPAKLEYNGIFQLVAGIFLIYVFFNFCIDMGVRAVKLGYYQIIAPIPILTLLLPGQKKVFENWRNYTISTFIDVFIRIFVLLIGLYAINHLPSVSDLANGSIISGGESVMNYARIFLILGIVLFIKQAPKLLEDLFGIKSGSFKLGIKDKLSEMPLVGGTVADTLGKAQGAATGAAGAAWTRGMDNRRHKKSVIEGALEGAKYGAAAGWKAGGRKTGNQFNAQRQGIWNGPMGGKGTTGWFGGQNWMEKKAEKAMNAFHDDYRDRVLSAKINKKEDVHDPSEPIHAIYENEKTSILNEKREEIKKLSSEKDKKTQEYNDAKRSYDNMFAPAKNQFELKKASELKKTEDDIKGVLKSRENDLTVASANFDANKKSALTNVEAKVSALNSDNLNTAVKAKADFEANKAYRINNLQKEMKNQRDLYDEQKNIEIANMQSKMLSLQKDGKLDEAYQIAQRIENYRKSEYDGSNLENQIQSIRNEKFEQQEGNMNLINNLNVQEKALFDEYNTISNTTFETDGSYQGIMKASKMEEERLREYYKSVQSEKFEDSDAYKAIEANEHTAIAKKELDEREENIKKLAEQIKKDSRILDETIKDKNIIQHVYKNGKLIEAIYDPNTGKTFDISDPDYDRKKAAAKVSDLEYEAYEASKKILRDRDETYRQEEKEHKKRINEKANEEWKNTEEAQRQIIAYSEAFKRMDNKSGGSKGGSSKDDKKE